MKDNLRFQRFLLDGGFTFGDEYIPPVWSIVDIKDRDSAISFLEFDNEHKDLCDMIINTLNKLMEDVK